MTKRRMMPTTKSARIDQINLFKSGVFKCPVAGAEENVSSVRKPLRTKGRGIFHVLCQMAEKVPDVPSSAQVAA